MKDNNYKDVTIRMNAELYHRLVYLGILNYEEDENDVRSYNVGTSDYAQHLIQPWTVWRDYNLDAWDADIVKRVLRTKGGEDPIMDYEKIIHDCNEKIRQLNVMKHYKDIEEEN